MAPIFVVEAAGIYHQKLAYRLYHQGRPVVVVLPSRASHFAKTLKVRTVTDSSSAEALMQMGLKKNLDLWQPPHPVFARLKQLTRERKRLKDEMDKLKNQRHADGGIGGSFAGNPQAHQPAPAACRGAYCCH